MTPLREAGAGATAPTDEELVALAREGGPASDAARALLERLAAPMRRLVARRVAGRIPPAAGPEDAAQESALALLEAVARFDPARPACAGGRPFRAFLGHVLHDRLSNWLRGLRRGEGRLDRSRDAAAELEARAGCAGAGLVAWRSDDPAAAAEWSEAWGRLGRALGALGEAERRLWDGLAGGRRLRALAAEGGDSYDHAKRSWRRTLTKLREAVGAAPPRPQSGRPRHGGLR